VPANPAVQRHVVPRLPIRACPSAPSHACSTLPHQTQSCPRYLACHAPREVPTRPCQPCLALARPHLASRALPRSASPISPSQPCLTFHAWPHLACQGWPGQAVPTKPCLPCPAISILTSGRLACRAFPSRTGSRIIVPGHACIACPDRAAPHLACHACHALPAWPFRPDRAMPAAPILASFGHAFRTMPAAPIPTNRVLPGLRTLTTPHVA
jgi:hypothetical protein